MVRDKPIRGSGKLLKEDCWVDDEEGHRGLPSVPLAQQHSDGVATPTNTDENDNGTNDEKCNGNEEDDVEYSQLREDIYSLFLTNRVTSSPFLFALFIFAFQVTLFSLILVDIVDLGSENPMNIPPGVTNIVSVSQFLLLPLAVAVEGDIFESFVMFHNGYDRNALKINHNTTYWNWLLFISLMFASGSLSLVTNFTLMVQSTSVLDMFLNFSALGMVLYTSTVAFSLAKLGFVSNRIQQATQLVCKMKIPTKSGSNILRRGAFLVLWSGLVLFWSIFFHWQQSGKYLASRLEVQFGDEYISDLAGFSGTYILDSEKKFSGRVVYIEEKSHKAMFGYCADLTAWTFTYGDSEDLDPCDFQALSTETQAYDITSLSSSDWLVGNEDKEPVPFLFLSLLAFDCEESDVMTCTESGGRQCMPQGGTYGSHCQFSEPCTSLDVSPGTRFQYNRNSRLYEGYWEGGEYFRPLPIKSSPYQAKGGKIYEQYLMVNERPVFAYDYSSHNINYTQLDMTDQSGFFELILFTGRRWIFTNSENLAGLQTNKDAQTKVEWLIDYFKTFHSFFSDYGAIYISDPTDYGTPTDRGTPERLTWYTVAPDTNNKPEESLQSDVVLLCSCDETNHCFEGVCVNRKGTYGDVYSVCDCVQGFGGSLCQKQCQEGFTGLQCDQQICGIETPCQHGGSCISTAGIQGSTEKICDCPQGYAGYYCETQCPKGYTGTNCEEKFCSAEEPCQNQGSCKTGKSDAMNSYQFCECPQGYAGDLCEIKCENGKTGPNCDEPVCGTNTTCLNDGFCDVRVGVSDTLSKFCHCAQGYGGALCEKRCSPGYTSTDCSEIYCGTEFPCAHNGTCETAIDEKGTPHTFCKCREGFGGPFCEDLCPSGFTGKYCDKVACSSKFPCQNSGKCKLQTLNDGSTQRYCSCPMGYGGPLCDQQCDPGYTGRSCLEKTCGPVVPCKNHGTCTTVTDGSIISSTFCQCQQGFGGFFCEEPCPYGTSGTFCDDHLTCSDKVPCLNRGICREPADNNTESSCVCQQGYGGTFCELLCPLGKTGSSCNEIAYCSLTLSNTSLAVSNTSEAVAKDNKGKQKFTIEVVSNTSVAVSNTSVAVSNTTATFSNTSMTVSNSSMSNASLAVSNNSRVDSNTSVLLLPENNSLVNFETCLNGGECVALEGNMTSATQCHCPRGMGGFLCETQCPYGYSGYYCDEPTCGDPFPCFNNGTCVKETKVINNSTVHQEYCECQTGFGGTMCDMTCPYGYQGPTCDERLECSSAFPCLNNGTCEVLKSDMTVNSTYCECQNGFGGTMCQTKCPYGYHGDFCHERASCNEFVPCLNEGVCKVQSRDSATFSSCECPLGFGGSLCHIKCPNGFTGNFCDLPAW